MSYDFEYIRICNIIKYYELFQFKNLYSEKVNKSVYLSSKDMQHTKKQAIEIVESYVLFHM